ncbi:SDR family NAD(P)-dependent oxidoreductase [Maribacter litoralis]|uniref:SDR family NAD(P)-dependent oxidoreductase n=1 Tax=Maribacter litoralis TaxID=2059726 RepID=UPI000E322748|nr:SDR family oxidoreductase [Maribacter litoralis]
MSNKTKIALVTGGSRGLGKSMALELAKKGLDVILTYHSKQEEVDKVVSEIEAMGNKASSLQLDVTTSNIFDKSKDDIKAILKSKFKTTHFDYLINNAGVGVYAPYDKITDAQLENMFKIHINAPFFLTQKLASLLNNGGGIVNISSGLARFTTPGYSAYATMKGGIETLTKYQAKFFGERKIRVNVIAPGAIETDFGGGVVRDNADLNNYITSTSALGRVGLPDDIGSVVAFLCTDDAKWVNAQRLEVSGGINF